MLLKEPPSHVQSRSWHTGGEPVRRIGLGRAGILMTLKTIIACSVLVLIDSKGLAGQRLHPTTLAAMKHLELPKLTGLMLNPLGAPLEQPRIPTGFFGCWVGNPRKFDTVFPNRDINSLYRLRSITKCYLPSRIETEQFTLELKPKHPMLENVLGWLSLGTYHAEVMREETGIYKITADQIYSRGALTLNLTAASLLQFTYSSRATVVDEEVATLVDPDTLTIRGRVFLVDSEIRSVGTWHAAFRH